MMNGRVLRLRLSRDGNIFAATYSSTTKTSTVDFKAGTNVVKHFTNVDNKIDSL
jgi:hypothetical protein